MSNVAASSVLAEVLAPYLPNGGARLVADECAAALQQAGLTPEGVTTVEWRTRNVAEGSMAFGRTYIAASEESARILGSGPSLVGERRTRTTYADRLGPWEAVSE